LRSGADGSALATSSVGQLNGVACLPSKTPSTTVCEAVGRKNSQGIALRSVNGGSTWKAQSVPPSGAAVYFGVSCASSTICEAVGTNSSSTRGFVIGTNNGGATWKLQSVPSAVAHLEDVSCRPSSKQSATTCEAVGFNTSKQGVAMGSTNGGATWKLQRCPRRWQRAR
jgi:photosystem II stability/assembly factor-like uncharacterized protein